MAVVAESSSGHFIGHYDSSADIAWIRFEGYDGRTAVSEEKPWGLEERDPDTGELVAIEIWQASDHLPAALLSLLPAPRPSQSRP